MLSSLTMALKGEGKGPLPPLLEQYIELRDNYPDYLVLFQVGDFYECFGEDAERLAKALGLILTHKTSRDFTTPMAGLPIRSADANIERLLKQGIRVAVADQTESSLEADKLVKRDITQLITPGTVSDERLLKADANYIAAVATGDGYGLSFLDVSTGEFRGTHVYSRSSLYDELQRYRPVEVLLAPELYEQIEFRQHFNQRFSVMLSQGRFDDLAILERHFGQSSQEFRHNALKRSAAAALSYALETQQGKLPQVKQFIRYDPGAYMHIGNVALKSLEVFDSQGEHDRSLFKLLNDTRTAPGRRLLKAWLRHPLLDASLIDKRLDAVEAFVRDGSLRTELRKALYKMQDLERLAARLAMGSVGARELVALARSVGLIPEIKTLLKSSHIEVLHDLTERLQPLQHLEEHIRSALLPDPPIKITEGGLIQTGFDTELDDLRNFSENALNWIATLEAQERQATGINNLKIGYNQVFGYYFEVTRPYYHLVPESYKAIQSLKDRQRYSRQDLRAKEKEILEAEQDSKKREYLLFDSLRAELAPFSESLQDTAALIAELDVLSTLADIAAKRQYCRPSFANDNTLEITAGRHAVVEAFHEFIPNDIHMSEQARLIILTGPNMSGKSTYLRQIALIALLAQIGAFVPAERATLPIFERIYTRIGASDDIAAGRSTFMVEMDELAHILQHASSKSLILLDEIGRGTSTYDGLALAWALCEYLHHDLGAFCLFATHYFELTTLVKDFPAMRNYHVAAREEAGGLTFYHQVLPGPASKSYGIEVAKLAGLPPKLLGNARRVMAGLESGREQKAEEILALILNQDLNRLSPLEALSLLSKIQSQMYQLSS